MPDSKQTTQDYINLKIEPQALKQLLKQKALLIQHVHCNDKQSKTALHQLLLDIALLPAN